MRFPTPLVISKKYMSIFVSLMANLWNLSDPSGSHMAAPHNQRELNWAGAHPAKNHAETSLFAHLTGKRKHEKGIYICLGNSSKSHLMPSITFIHENPLPLQCPSFTFNPKFVFWKTISMENPEIYFPRRALFRTSSFFTLKASSLGWSTPPFQ